MSHRVVLPFMGRFTHYKRGGTYVVYFTARHTETEKQLMVYRCETTGQVWARPRHEFFEEVMVKCPIKGEVRFVPRFTRLKD